MAKTKIKEPEPLLGKELLQKLKELGHLSKRATAKECGYYSLTKDGKVRVNLGEFYDAVLSAKGIQLEADKGKDSRGREASYTVTVHKNGQIVIGSAYTREMGLQPGDEFDLKLGYKNIRLVKKGEEEDE